MAVEVQALIPIEEYLSTSYSPEYEFRDGVLLERNVGDLAQAALLTSLATYICSREKQWNVMVFISLRIKIRDRCYRVPDLCVYTRPAPRERYPERPPLLWIEILSEDDRVADVWSKARELVKNGVPYVWIIDPHTLESQLWTSTGAASVPDHTLRLQETAIVIPLLEVMAQ